MLMLKGPANERGESPAAVLLITNSPQMFDSLFNCLHMAEHHRGARFQSELVRDLHHLEPLVAVYLYGEIFCRTRSTRISPPPPGIDPSPAFLNCEITSRSGIPKVSAKC